MNAMHYHAALKRNTTTPHQGNRSAIENTITLFDECGLIITSSDPSLLDLIRDFKWKELFWHRRDELTEELRCVVIGHALYEKALNPYIGMTGHAVLVDVDDTFNALDNPTQINFLDTHVCNLFRSNKEYIATAMLTPFPLLGLPGWINSNDNEEFYNNSHYFRSRRRSH